MSNRLPDPTTSNDQTGTAAATAAGTGEALRPTPWQVVIGTLLAMLLFAYPHLFAALMERAGVRVAALALLGYGAIFAAARRAMGIPVQWWSLPHVGTAAVVAVTAYTADPRYLMMVPALVYLMLCKMFWDSLSAPLTVIEQVARFIVPFAPDFIRSYCRKSTVAWSGFFAINAAVIAWLALSGRAEAWRAYTGWQMFAVIGAICLVDFLIRKWWFRYYFHNHLFDRVWSRYFPAEATPTGRRSMEYIRQMRRELGMDG